MKLNPQIIYKNHVPTFVVLPFKEYSAAMEMIEDYLINEEIERQKKAGGEIFPGDLIFSIVNGKNRIQAYREYRQLSVDALAQEAKIKKEHIEDIEAGRRDPSIKVLRALAQALNIDFSLLH